MEYAVFVQDAFEGPFEWSSDSSLGDEGGGGGGNVPTPPPTPPPDPELDLQEVTLGWYPDYPDLSNLANHDWAFIYSTPGGVRRQLMVLEPGDTNAIQFRHYAGPNVPSEVQLQVVLEQMDDGTGSFVGTEFLTLTVNNSIQVDVSFSSADNGTSFAVKPSIVGERRLLSGFTAPIPLSLPTTPGWKFYDIDVQYLGQRDLIVSFAFRYYGDGESRADIVAVQDLPLRGFTGMNNNLLEQGNENGFDFYRRTDPNNLILQAPVLNLYPDTALYPDQASKFLARFWQCLYLVESGSARLQRFLNGDLVAPSFQGPTQVFATYSQCFKPTAGSNITSVRFTSFNDPPADVNFYAVLLWTLRTNSS